MINAPKNNRKPQNQIQDRNPDRSTAYKGEPWRMGICGRFGNTGACDRVGCRFEHLTPDAYKQREKDYNDGKLIIGASAANGSANSSDGDRK